MRTEVDSLKIMLQALNDPENIAIKSQIKRALKVLGLSHGDISYYEMTGHPPPGGFHTDYTDNMNTLEETRMRS